MSTPGALLRLFRRRATLLLVPLPAAIVVPLVAFYLLPNRVPGLRHDELVAFTASTIWYAAIMLPFAIGAAAASARLELQTTQFSWILPGLRRGLLGGTLLSAFVVAAALAAIAVQALSPGDTAAVFALALFAFMAGGTVPDPAFSAATRWLAALVLVTGLAALAAGVAAGFGYLTLLLPGFVPLMARAQFSVTSARRRPFVQSNFRDPAAGRFRLGAQRARRTWTSSLDTDGVWPWLRAAAYEASGVLTGGYAGRLLVLAAVAVVWAHLTNAPAMVLILAGVYFSGGSLQLIWTTRYPLARARRASIAFAGTLADAVAFCAAVIAVELLHGVSPVRVPNLFGAASAASSWPVAIAVAFALAPLAQWSAVLDPRAAWRGTGNSLMLRGFGPLMAYMLAGVIAFSILGHARLPLDGGTVAALLVTLSAAIQLTHLLALRRYYTRADLVGAS